MNQLPVTSFLDLVSHVEAERVRLAGLQARIEALGPDREAVELVAVADQLAAEVRDLAEQVRAIVTDYRTGGIVFTAE